MGSGKTTWAINYIKNNPNKSYVYVTPLLEQINRIQGACSNAQFRDPKPIDGRKINGLNSLLESGANIAVTHATFANSNADTLQYLQAGNYVLLLDEVLDILLPFNDVATNTIKKGDPKLMIDEGIISVDDYGRVKWISDKPYADSTFADVKRLADRGNLLLLDDALMVWEFPADIFDTFAEVYVMTYLFSGSYLRPYFDYNSIKYEMVTLHGGEIVPYQPTPPDQLEQIRRLINLDTNSVRNDYRNYSLSKNWYQANKPKRKVMQKNLYNYFRNEIKTTADKIMWTAFEQYKSELTGNGYTRRKNITDEELKDVEMRFSKTEDRQKAIARMKDCYVPNNARASNDYRRRNTVAYCINMFPNKYIENYFERRKHPINKDMLALSCMLQFIWRSAIRDGEPINLYVPSTRMRELMLAWLDERLICDAIAA